MDPPYPRHTARRGWDWRWDRGRSSARPITSKDMPYTLSRHAGRTAELPTGATDSRGGDRRRNQMGGSTTSRIKEAVAAT